MEWAVNDYNTVRPHSSLNYLTPDEFEARIMKDKNLRKIGSKNRKGGMSMSNSSNEFKKLSERSGSTSFT